MAFLKQRKATEFQNERFWETWIIAWDVDHTLMKQVW